MNNENNTPVATRNKQLIEKMLLQLDRTTGEMPIDQLLTELQVVVERFTFHEITRDTAAPLSEEDLETLLQDDISPGVRHYVEWIASQKALSLFVNNNGSLFLSYCTRYYKTVPEIVISTAVPISDEMKKGLIRQLREVHPLPARLIFKVSPSVVAGCTIASVERTYDYSLKRTMVDSIMRYTEKHFLKTEGLRG